MTGTNPLLWSTCNGQDTRYGDAALPPSPLEQTCGNVLRAGRPGHPCTSNSQYSPVCRGDEPEISPGHSTIRPVTSLHPCTPSGRAVISPHCLPASSGPWGSFPPQRLRPWGGGMPRERQNRWASWTRSQTVRPGSGRQPGVTGGKHPALLSSHLSFSTQLAEHLIHFLGLSGPQFPHSIMRQW